MNLFLLLKVNRWIKYYVGYLIVSFHCQFIFITQYIHTTAVFNDNFGFGWFKNLENVVIIIILGGLQQTVILYLWLFPLK